MATRKSKTGLTRLCAVCGDKAIAKNFDVWSCKSCKPFFRRNAHLCQVLKCFRGGTCKINMKTRKKCRKCRLDKCFAKGMRMDWILNDEERAHRNKLILDNRRKKSKDGDEQDDDSQYSGSMSDSPEQSEPKEQDDCNKAIMANNISEQDMCELDEFVAINEIMQQSLNHYKSVIEPSIPRSVTNYEANYNELEDYKLSELFQLMNKLTFNTKGTLVDPKDIKELVRHGGLFYENETIRMIQIIKMMDAFETINENDRIALVKYSAIEILIFRTVFLYDTKHHAWRLPIGEFVSFYRMHEFRLSPDGLALYKNKWNTIHEECGSDTVIVDLLTAIALFNPNRPNIVDRTSVDVQQRVYMHLLKRYLLFKYRVKSESEDKFRRLLNILLFSQIIGQLERRYLYEPNHDVCGALCLELFDINASPGTGTSARSTRSIEC